MRCLHPLDARIGCLSHRFLDVLGQERVCDNRTLGDNDRRLEDSFQLRGPVATQNPDHIASIFETVGQVVRKEMCIRQIVVTKQARASTPGRGQLVAPDRNQCHLKSVGCRLLHNLDDAVEIRRIRLAGIVVDQR